jgi:hypothetical protein
MADYDRPMAESSRLPDLPNRRLAQVHKSALWSHLTDGAIEANVQKLLGSYDQAVFSCFADKFCHQGHIIHPAGICHGPLCLHDVGTFLRHDLWFVGRDTVCDACSDTMVSGGVHGVYDADGRLVVGGWLMKKVQMSICKVMDTHNLINRKRHGRARILQSLDVMCQQRKTR